MRMPLSFFKIKHLPGKSECFGILLFTNVEGSSIVETWAEADGSSVRVAVVRVYTRQI